MYEDHPHVGPLELHLVLFDVLYLHGLDPEIAGELLVALLVLADVALLRADVVETVVEEPVRLDRVFLEKVTQVALGVVVRRRQVPREEDVDRQRLGEVPDRFAARFRQGVDPVRCQVAPEEEGLPGDVDQDDDHEVNEESVILAHSHLPVHLSPFLLLFLEDQESPVKRHEDDAHKVKDVSRVEYSARHVLEMIVRPDELEESEHITERAFEVWLLSRGCSIAYSSIRYFKNDLAKHKPQWMVLVPRVLEKIAAGVQDKFASGSAAVKVLSKTFTKTSEARAANTKILKGLVVGEELPGPLQKAKAKAVVASLTPANAVGDKLVWSKVKEGFGGRLKAIIAGGSALAGSLEHFYEAAGITILVGYGLTECSPILSFRRRDNNLVTAGCAGHPAVDTEIRIVDPESKPTAFAERKALPDGTAGVIIARGPQVMKGYYKNPEATAKAIDKFGWFDTGDLGRINPATGDLILTGRAKDTIVLSNGENIEPIPIEDAIMCESPLIDQVMLTGQDGRGLVAIVVLNPNELAQEGFLDAKTGNMLQAQFDKVNDPLCTEEDCKEGCDALNEASDKLRGDKNLAKTLREIATKATSEFRPWERVSDVYLTLEPFAMANGQLTQSYKVKRAQVAERYEGDLGK